MRVIRAIVMLVMLLSILSLVANAQITQLAELTASDGAAGDNFGGAVAISGNTAVVGAPDALLRIGHGGVAYVFGGSGGTWNQVAKLTPSDGSNQFGASVAISGSTVVIGAPRDTVNGAVYVFVEPVAGWTDMTETAKLTTSGVGQLVGQSVAINTEQTTIVAAAYFGGGYVWTRPPNGWTTTTSATAEMVPPPSSGDFHGIAISASTVALAVYDGATSVGGAVYVFLLKPGMRKLSPVATLTGSDETSSSEIWTSVAVSGDTIVAGAPDHNSTIGAAYVFVKPSTGWTDMTQTAELGLTTGQPLTALGSSVAISGRVVLAGAPGDFIGQNQAQGVFFGYLEPSGGWVDTSTPSLSRTSNDGAAGDDFGTSISISGSTIAVGTPGHAVNGNGGQGAAYIFGPKP